MSLLESSRGKNIWIPKSSGTLQLPVTVPVATPMLGKNPNQYYMICGILHFERFSDTKQVQNHALCQGCLDHIRSKAHLSFMRFSEVQEGQAEPTCNYVSKV